MTVPATAGDAALAAALGAAPTAGMPPNLQLVLGILLFVLAGFGMVFVGLGIGKFVRPRLFHPEKLTPYECGEPPIGDSWVQFDLRFYTVALVFIVFDVEVALLWPWAVVYRDLGAPAFWAFLVFFLLIAVPFVYEWHSGYLEWVRASTAQRRRAPRTAPGPAAPPAGEYAAPRPQAPEPALTPAGSSPGENG